MMQLPQLKFTNNVVVGQHWHSLEEERSASTAGAGAVMYTAAAAAVALVGVCLSMYVSNTCLRLLLLLLPPAVSPVARLS